MAQLMFRALHNGHIGNCLSVCYTSKKSGIHVQPHRMAAHARLKNEFMEGDKYHKLMMWFY